MSGQVLLLWAIFTVTQLMITRKYMLLPIGQDEGIWLLWGVTGSRPYLDHVDCKPPGVHLWGLLLAKLGRKNIRAIKLLHHSAVAGCAAILGVLVHDVDAALAFAVLAHSIRLNGNHAWVEQLSAFFFAVTLVAPASLAVPSALLAVLCNTKLAVPALFFLGVRHGWSAGGLFALCAALGVAGIYIFKPRLLSAIFFGCFTVSQRMVKLRRQSGSGLLPPLDDHLGGALLLVVPALAAALVNSQDAALWGTALLYVLLNSLGRVWRPYHLIPLAAPVAVAAPDIAVFLVIADFAAAGFYLGDPLTRLRPWVGRRMHEARNVGRFLEAKEGSLWVSNAFTQIYVYAKKPPGRLPVEQVEIAPVIPERRLSGASTPRFSVIGPSSDPSILRDPGSYKTIFVCGLFSVLERGGECGNLTGGGPDARDGKNGGARRGVRSRMQYIRTSTEHPGMLT